MSNLLELLICGELLRLPGTADPHGHGRRRLRVQAGAGVEWSRAYRYILSPLNGSNTCVVCVCVWECINTL